MATGAVRRSARAELGRALQKLEPLTDADLPRMARRQRA
jgi:hypothetical protein